MGHIVAFEGADRNPAYHRCEELADAVSFVEKLRNDRGVESVQIFRTEEIVFDFKPYYRVEIGSLGAGSTPAGAIAASSTPAASASPVTSPSTAPVTAPSMTPPPPITSMATPGEPTSTEDSVEGVEGGEFDGEFDENDDDLSAAGSRRGLFGR